LTRKILVVDDDRKIVELIRLYLEKEGYQALVAYDGRQAIELVRQRQPDLVVLDLMLPMVDGLDVCRILRAESRVPIIMLTARTTEGDKLLGLDLGADDYVTKPFSPRELMARIRAVLRRTGETDDKEQAEIHAGELVVDLFRHQARMGDELLNLTPKEFKLLEIMVKARGKAFSRTQLLEEAFGLDYEGLERTVDVHIMNLRKKVEADPENPVYIRTVYGYGYKFAEEDEVS